MTSLCFIECHRERIPAILGKWANVFPMAVWGCQAHENNTGRLDFLKKLPVEQRAIRFDWFADPTVPRGPQIVADVSKERQRLKLKARFRLAYTDQEKHGLPNMASDMVALTKIAENHCNWNSCAGGEAWWGPYTGPAYDLSCPESYRVTNDDQYAKYSATLAACAPACVVHLPPCYKAPFNEADKAEGTTATYAYMRQLLIDAHSLGVRTYIMADYMVEADKVNRYYQIISETLTDCDRRA